MKLPSGDRGRGEAGAFIVLWALLLVALFGMVAIVIDLGHARSARRQNQTIADMAALAATTKMKATRQGVCTDAWNYVKENASGLPSSAPNPCTSAPATACVSTTSQVTYPSVAGPYRVDITYPVVSTEALNDPRFPAVNDRCKIVQVSVTQTNDTFFGGVLGLNQLAPQAHAVARSGGRDIRNIPAFWLLEPSACNVADLVGGSKITVGSASTPGLAVFDTAANAPSGCSPRSILTVGGSGFINVHPPVPDPADPEQRRGRLLAYALSEGCAAPCHNAGSKVNVPTEASDTRTGRVAVDEKYLAAIQQLRALVGTSGTPTGYNRITTCSVNGGSFSGNTFVDCPGGFTASGNVLFNGNVVFAGGVSTTSGASLEFRRTNTTASTPVTEPASFVYLRSGNFQNVNLVRFTDMMLYLHAGFISSTTGSGRIQWSPPAHGAFKDLSLWAETTQMSTFQGGSAACGSSEQVSLNGIFFLPNSQLRMQGGGTLCSTAQYISKTLQMNGGTQVQVVAPTTGIEIKTGSSGLIR